MAFDQDKISNVGAGLVPARKFNSLEITGGL